MVGERGKEAFAAGTESLLHLGCAAATVLHCDYRPRGARACRFPVGPCFLGVVCVLARLFVSCTPSIFPSLGRRWRLIMTRSFGLLEGSGDRRAGNPMKATKDNPEAFKLWMMVKVL